MNTLPLYLNALVFTCTPTKQARFDSTAASAATAEWTRNIKLTKNLSRISAVSCATLQRTCDGNAQGSRNSKSPLVPLAYTTQATSTTIIAFHPADLPLSAIKTCVYKPQGTISFSRLRILGQIQQILQRHFKKQPAGSERRVARTTAQFQYKTSTKTSQMLDRTMNKQSAPPAGWSGRQSLGAITSGHGY